MNDAYEINRRISGAYIVNAASITRLAEVIEAAVGIAPKLTMEFRNSRSVSSDSVSDIDDSYVGIEYLEKISLYASNGRKTCSLIIGWTSSTPIYFDIKMPRLEARDLEVQLENVLLADATWYHALFKLKQSSVAFSTLLGLIALALIILTILFTNWPDALLKSPYFVNSYKALVVLTIVNIIFDLALPSIMFDIGKSGRRIRTRKAVFGFLVLVVLAGVGVNLLSDVVKPYLLP